MYVGKYQLLTQEEVLAIVNFFIAKGQVLAEDVNYPRPGENIGFAQIYKMAEAHLISTEDHDLHMKFATINNENETYRNFWACGFWTTDDTDFVPQAIFKTVDGKF